MMPEAVDLLNPVGVQQAHCYIIPRALLVSLKATASAKIYFEDWGSGLNEGRHNQTNPTQILLGQKCNQEAAGGGTAGKESVTGGVREKLSIMERIG
jgi:hypothetical protein